MPPALAAMLGQMLGALLAHFLPREREIAAKQVRLASRTVISIDGSDRGVWRIFKENLKHVALSIVELNLFEAALCKNPKDWGAIEVKEVGEPFFHDSASSETGVLAVSGHIGNFELLAAFHANNGNNIIVIGREPNYDLISIWLDNLRTLYGVNSVWRSGRKSATAFLRAIREKKTLAVLVDQDANLDNMFSPFFGVPAASPSAPIELAIRHGLKILITFIVRVAPYKHEVHSEYLTYDKSDPDAAQKILDAFNLRLQSLIARYPEQWVWFHRRWRRRPGINYMENPSRLRSNTEYLKWLEGSNLEMLQADEKEIASKHAS